MCDGTNHPLIVIGRVTEVDWKTDFVVRWCPDCGAVVIDAEIDGRTLAGHFSKMRFPKTAYRSEESK